MINVDTLLVDAMNAEIKAKEFYLDASQKAQSPSGKQFFKELADFEQRHYERVKNIIESRKAGQQFDTYEPPHIPMIDAEIKGEVEPNKDEIVDVINLAIQAEKDAQKRYENIAQALDDQEAKKLFEGLAEEENKHQRLLEDQFYHMSNKGTIIWGE
ncbi:MAG: ferritin family protein [candidate division WOR-3 bacterium]|nr:MAG: ferritin family protein [candidate division WOR-3 bacterium]